MDFNQTKEIEPFNQPADIQLFWSGIARFSDAAYIQKLFHSQIYEITPDIIGAENFLLLLME